MTGIPQQGLHICMYYVYYMNVYFEKFWNLESQQSQKKKTFTLGESKKESFILSEFQYKKNKYEKYIVDFVLWYGQNGNNNGSIISTCIK